jgi:hypothetical protein
MSMSWWLWDRGIGIAEERCGGRGRKRRTYFLHVPQLGFSFKLRWEAIGRGQCLSQKGSGAEAVYIEWCFK